ncbi:MAG: HEAT repeat domain-containing protein [Deltaproteobacteria bacterium]|nr:MAG: HEAT repeat domain-containing protein [Deltaproteobacteria bacterium]
MNRLEMNKCAYAAKVLVLGLVSAQVLATIQVYLSNADLYDTLIIIKDAGYLPIPNERIIHRLQEFSPAFFGGLFFTLSVGAGLSILSLAAAWIWDRILFRNRIVLVVFLLLWIGCIVVVNRGGFCPMVTSYFLVIPPVVWSAALRWMPPQAKQGAWVNRMVHFIPIALLAVLWTSQMNSHLFSDIRDHLLLSNSIGKKVNYFYYKYTLYPAEVFKSLDQKILKTCNIESIREQSIMPYLERGLLNHDYLIVSGDATIDLKIAQEDNVLVFENEERAILRAPVKAFVSRPGAVLKEFSQKSDRYAFFRQFTFFSLLIGFPITLYIFLYAVLCFVLRLFLDSLTSSVIASLLCFLLGIALLGHLHHSREKKIEVKDLADTLESERWQERVAALKFIGEHGLDLADFQGYKGMLKSPHIAERYWLARGLGVSRRPETYQDLLAILDDPHPNVVSMAFNALGQRGDMRAIREIRERIETSDDWYNQWYAYKALRALGWKQSRLR